VKKRDHDAAMGAAWHLEDWPAVRAECDRMVAQRPAFVCSAPDCGRPVERNGMCRHCYDESNGVRRKRVYRYHWPPIDAMRHKGMTWVEIAASTGYKAQQLQWAYYHRNMKRNGRR